MQLCFLGSGYRSSLNSHGRQRYSLPVIPTSAAFTQVSDVWNVGASSLGGLRYRWVLQDPFALV